MTYLNKYTEITGNKQKGFYTVRTIVANKKNELCAKYVKYMNNKKVSLTRYYAFILHGELIITDCCLNKKIYTN
jgi:hypothetical protein